MSATKLDPDPTLPAGWAFSRLDEIAVFNPKNDVSTLRDDDSVHFVPMAAVEEDFGGMNVSTLRHFAEVKKGYTSFRAGDVLLAKITPCMENGKGGLVPELSRAVAFGSTEFHVLRPSIGIAGA